MCRLGKPDPRVCCIVNCVEALQESIAVDKIETLAGISANVVDDEIDGAGTAPNLRVQRTRPDLSIGCELIRYLNAKSAAVIKKNGAKLTPLILKKRLESLAY